MSMNNKLLNGLALLMALAGSLSAAEKLRVVASFLPVYAHAKSVAGELAEVKMFLDQDAEPHDYEFKPADIKRLAAADLFIVSGAGVEEWLGEVLKNSGKQSLTVVDASKGVPLLKDNPHYWLDPVLAQTQVENILQALVVADAKNAAAYRKNAAAYLEKLRKLDADYHMAFEKLPEKKSPSEKNLVTLHDAFPYLAKRYGLNYIGSLAPLPEQDPKPADLKALVLAIKKNQIKIIFAENGYSPKLLEEIARQSGATVGELDTLETGAPSADAYLVRMRANLAALEKAWKK
ncbi:MAG: zinc ABC transporter substrate-binding protein [Verrucomicrobiales bacterium]|jgi:ABC-type Zn uptake system ZnuABC Zn-binding protein ZnuA|nr:zinc ABC transporter substrate-binding protein [Verrucomicrobiales bacterium]